MFFFHVTLFPKNIQGNFTWILPLKKTEIAEATANYIMQYKLTLAK